MAALAKSEIRSEDAIGGCCRCAPNQLAVKFTRLGWTIAAKQSAQSLVATQSRAGISLNVSFTGIGDLTCAQGFKLH